MTIYYITDLNRNVQVATFCSSLDMLSLLLSDNDKVITNQPANEDLAFNLTSVNDKALCVKDLNGRYLFCNKHYIDLVGINNLEYRGKTDIELSSVMMEFKDEINTQDKVVVSNLRTIKTLNINNFHRSNKKTMVVFFKSPIFDLNNNLKAIYYIEEDINDYYDTCYKINKNLFGFESNTCKNLDLSWLTNSENEVVYLLVCGYKLIEIANILKKSYSTVRSYQQSAISKFDLVNIRQLIENIRLSYLPKFIPNRFLVNKSIII
ncbi:PAS and helix-turn-helix domain-containing protein [Photobacterium carnosum]|uniref:PAS and helix-turn-helix domain-containing protein n=1 Tax=Photobacterium carnosum TaxID=2023717 RepID=UPI001E38CC6D|nr:PAS and helix-turn-helix domain-containing protein [Photobacterium carnosum]MCD9538980.1 PAS domain-containing protein [Photobacterium carnosum]MCF2163665.1 PAS domain-containing protein [Photobacterium carnosum]